MPIVNVEPGAFLTALPRRVLWAPLIPSCDSHQRPSLCIAQDEAGAFLTVLPRRVFFLVEDTAESRHAFDWIVDKLLQPDIDEIFLVSPPTPPAPAPPPPLRFMFRGCGLPWNTLQHVCVGRMASSRCAGRGGGPAGGLALAQRAGSRVSHDGPGSTWLRGGPG